VLSGFIGLYFSRILIAFIGFALADWVSVVAGFTDASLIEGLFNWSEAEKVLWLGRLEALGIQHTSTQLIRVLLIVLGFAIVGIHQRFKEFQKAISGSLDVKDIYRTLTKDSLSSQDKAAIERKLSKGIIHGWSNPGFKKLIQEKVGPVKMGNLTQKAVAHIRYYLWPLANALLNIALFALPVFYNQLGIAALLVPVAMGGAYFALRYLPGQITYEIVDGKRELKLSPFLKKHSYLYTHLRQSAQTWTSFWGMYIVSTEISAITNGAEFLTKIEVDGIPVGKVFQPIDNLTQAFEGPHGLISIGNQFMGTVLGYYGHIYAKTPQEQNELILDTMLDLFGMNKEAAERERVISMLPYGERDEAKRVSQEMAELEAKEELSDAEEFYMRDLRGQWSEIVSAVRRIQLEREITAFRQREDLGDIGELQLEQLILYQDIEELQEELSDLRQELKLFRKAKETTEDQASLSALEEKIKPLNDRILEAEGRVEQIQAEIKTLSERILRAQIEELKETEDRDFLQEAQLRRSLAQLKRILAAEAAQLARRTQDPAGAASGQDSLESRSLKLQSLQDELDLIDEEISRSLDVLARSLSELKLNWFDYLLQSREDREQLRYLKILLQEAGYPLDKSLARALDIFFAVQGLPGEKDVFQASDWALLIDELAAKYRHIGSEDDAQYALRQNRRQLFIQRAYLDNVRPELRGLQERIIDIQISLNELKQNQEAEDNQSAIAQLEQELRGTQIELQEKQLALAKDELTEDEYRLATLNLQSQRLSLKIEAEGEEAAREELERVLAELSRQRERLTLIALRKEVESLESDLKEGIRETLVLGDESFQVSRIRQLVSLGLRYTGNAQRPERPLFPGGTMFDDEAMILSIDGWHFPEVYTKTLQFFVKQLQERLELPVTGQWDSQTQEAIVRVVFEAIDKELEDLNSETSQAPFNPPSLPQETTGTYSLKTPGSEPVEDLAFGLSQRVDSGSGRVVFAPPSIPEETAGTYGFNDTVEDSVQGLALGGVRSIESVDTQVPFNPASLPHEAPGRYGFSSDSGQTLDLALSASRTTEISRVQIPFRPSILPREIPGTYSFNDTVEESAQDLALRLVRELPDLREARRLAVRQARQAVTKAEAVLTDNQSAFEEYRYQEAIAEFNAVITELDEALDQEDLPSKRAREVRQARRDIIAAKDNLKEAESQRQQRVASAELLIRANIGHVFQKLGSPREFSSVPEAIYALHQKDQDRMVLGSSEYIDSLATLLLNSPEPDIWVLYHLRIADTDSAERALQEFISRPNGAEKYLRVVAQTYRPIDTERTLQDALGVLGEAFARGEHAKEADRIIFALREYTFNNPEIDPWAIYVLKTIGSWKGQEVYVTEYRNGWYYRVRTHRQDPHAEAANALLREIKEEFPAEYVIATAKARLSGEEKGKLTTVFSAMQALAGKYSEVREATGDARYVSEAIAENADVLAAVLLASDNDTLKGGASRALRRLAAGGLALGAFRHVLEASDDDSLRARLIYGLMDEDLVGNEPSLRAIEELIPALRAILTETNSREYISRSSDLYLLRKNIGRVLVYATEEGSQIAANELVWAINNSENDAIKRAVWSRFSSERDLDEAMVVLKVILYAETRTYEPGRLRAVARLAIGEFIDAKKYEALLALSSDRAIEGYRRRLFSLMFEEGADARVIARQLVSDIVSRPNGGIDSEIRWGVFQAQYPENIRALTEEAIVANIKYRYISGMEEKFERLALAGIGSMYRAKGLRFAERRALITQVAENENIRSNQMWTSYVTQVPDTLKAMGWRWPESIPVVYFGKVVEDSTADIEPGRNVLVAVRAGYDWNGALNSFYYIVQQAMKSGWAVKYGEASTEDEAIAFTRKATREGRRPAQAGLYAGHAVSSTGEGLSFSDRGREEAKFDIGDKQQGDFRQLRGLFALKASDATVRPKIILLSCHAAAGGAEGNNIVNAMQDELGQYQLVSSRMAANIEEIKFNADGTVDEKWSSDEAGYNAARERSQTSQSMPQQPDHSQAAVSHNDLLQRGDDTDTEISYTIPVPSLSRMHELPLQTIGYRVPLVPLLPRGPPASVERVDFAASTDNALFAEFDLKGSLDRSIAAQLAAGTARDISGSALVWKFSPHSTDPGGRDTTDVPSQENLDEFSRKYRDEAGFSYYDYFLRLANSNSILVADTNGFLNELKTQAQSDEELRERLEKFYIHSTWYRDSQTGREYVIIDRSFFESATPAEIMAKIIHEIGALKGKTHEFNLRMEMRFLFAQKDFIPPDAFMVYRQRLAGTSLPDIEDVQFQAYLRQLEQDRAGGYKPAQERPFVSQRVSSDPTAWSSFADEHGLGEVTAANHNTIRDYARRHPSELIYLVFSNASSAYDLPADYLDFAAAYSDVKVLLVTSEEIAGLYNASRIKRGNTTEIRIISGDEIVGWRYVTGQRLSISGDLTYSYLNERQTLSGPETAAQTKVVREEVKIDGMRIRLGEFIEYNNGTLLGEIRYSYSSKGFVFVPRPTIYEDVSDWSPQYQQGWELRRGVWQRKDSRILNKYQPSDTRNVSLVRQAVRTNDSVHIYFDRLASDYIHPTSSMSYLIRWAAALRPFVPGELVSAIGDIWRYSLTHERLQKQTLRINNWMDDIKDSKENAENLIKYYRGGFDDIVEVELLDPMQAKAIVLRDNDTVLVEIISTVRTDKFVSGGSAFYRFKLDYDEATGRVKWQHDGWMYDMPYSEFLKALATMRFFEGVYAHLENLADTRSDARRLIREEVSLNTVLFQGRTATEVKVRDPQTGQMIHEIILPNTPPESLTGHLNWLIEHMRFIRDNRSFIGRNTSLVFSTVTAARIFDDVLVLTPIVQGRNNYWHPATNGMQELWLYERVQRGDMTEIIPTRRIGDSSELRDYTFVEETNGVRTVRQDILPIRARDIFGHTTRRFAVEEGKLGEYVQFFKHPSLDQSQDRRLFWAALSEFEELTFLPQRPDGTYPKGQRIVQAIWDDATRTITVYKDDAHTVAYARLLDIDVMQVTDVHPEGEVMHGVKAVAMYTREGKFERLFTVRMGSDDRAAEHLRFYKDPDRVEGHVAVFSRFEMVRGPV
jgi:hypothetical protein